MQPLEEAVAATGTTGCNASLAVLVFQTARNDYLRHLPHTDSILKEADEYGLSFMRDYIWFKEVYVRQHSHNPHYTKDLNISSSKRIE